MKNIMKNINNFFLNNIYCLVIYHFLVICYSLKNYHLYLGFFFKSYKMTKLPIYIRIVFEKIAQFANSFKKITQF